MIFNFMERICFKIRNMIQVILLQVLFYIVFKFQLKEYDNENKFKVKENGGKNKIIILKGKLKIYICSLFE